MARAHLVALAVTTALSGCGGVGPADMSPPPLDMAVAAATPDMASANGDAGAMPAKFSALYTGYLNLCANCHAPNAPGRTSDIEATLDFTSVATAHRTLTTGMAAGLVGNSTACNGVPFIQSLPEQSLLVAVLDKPTRDAFDLTTFPSCDSTAITDQTFKVGTQPSAAFISALKLWITAGAPNN
jgi:hypothetical protein